MSDFKSECIEGLINAVRRVGLSKCSFELYMSSEIKPSESNENQDIDKVPVLLDEIKRKYSLSYDIKDTRKMDSIEVKRAYDQCAHWAQNPKKHEYRTSQTIYHVFLGGEAGDWFGKKRPAMIAYVSSSGDVVFVLPHEVEKDHFSITEWTHGRKVFSRLETTICIYDFLKDLKQDLDSEQT